MLIVDDCARDAYSTKMSAASGVEAFAHHACLLDAETDDYMRMGCHLIVNSLLGFLRAPLSVAFLRADLFRFLLTLDAVAVPGDGFQAIGVDPCRRKCILRNGSRLDYVAFS
jgi:hypothetical protein